MGKGAGNSFIRHKKNAQINILGGMVDAYAREGFD